MKSSEWESGDQAVGLLLIRELVEVGWHHDWATGTWTAVQYEPVRISPESRII